MKYTGPRIECPWCSKAVGTYVPSRGDGSGFIINRHQNKDRKRCQGSLDLIVVGKTRPFPGDRIAKVIED